MESLSDPRHHSYESISLGMQERRDYVISPHVYANFLDAFDDRSPIHVDEAYALGRGFSGRVMHGALLNGFLSHFVGMHFPGRPSLLLSVDLRFAEPSYLGDVICIEAIVTRKMDARRVIVIDATFRNVTRERIVARGRVQVMVRDEP